MKRYFCEFKQFWRTVLFWWANPGLIFPSPISGHDFKWQEDDEMVCDFCGLKESEIYDYE